MKLAIVGSGIAGLSSAWMLQAKHDITLFEQDARLGGHTNTVTVDGPDGPQPVDTGFIVYNARNYPNLIALFEHLGVETQPSSMSFSASIAGGGIEWAGNGTTGLFAQKRNSLRPSHYRMIFDILRFNRATKALLDDRQVPRTSVGEFLDQGHYGHAFRARYLLPMAACIWSCPTGQILDFPLISFLRFFRNHGLLDLKNRPQWRTVCGGSSSYIDKLTAGLGERIRVATPVVSISRNDAGVTVTTQGGKAEQFDGVVLACHSDQALALLNDPSADERSVLGAIPYGPNRAVLHTDTALMPQRKAVWSSWNYLADRDTVDNQRVSLSYWMNRLQSIPGKTQYIVTVNPTTEPRADTILADIDYEHPVFSMDAVRAQQQLPGIQGQRTTWFCGAWAGYGFHEDGLRSAVDVASLLDCPPPWLAQPSDDSASTGTANEARAAA